jgi:transposase
MAVTLSPGQQHETRQFEALMEEVIAWPVLPERLAGDKGYSAGWVREWLEGHGIKSVIPTKKNETPDKKFDKKRYRRRNVVERCIGNLKWFRRVATRYEKLAVHYLAAVKLAIIFRLL